MTRTISEVFFKEILPGLMRFPITKSRELQDTRIMRVGILAKIINGGESGIILLAMEK